MFAKGTFSKAVLLSGVILATTVACERYEIDPIAGNTYDRFNQIDVLSPHADLINVSYELEYIDDAEFFEDNPYEGKSWVFASRDADIPSEVVQIHLVDKSVEKLGESESIGFRDFKTASVCVSTESMTEKVSGVVSRMASTGLTSSDALFVKVYASDFESSDNQRTDLVYLRDLSTSGLTCNDLENDEAVNEAVNYQANHSFEVLG